MPRTQAFQNVKRVKRHDRIDYYHLKAKVRLPGEYGSHEFIAAWLEAQKQITAVVRKGPDQETYAGLWAAFEASPDWLTLKPRTQSDYTKVRDWMFSIGADTKPARDMQQRHAEKLLDRAVKETWPRFALYVLQVNRRLYNWVQKRDARRKLWGGTNPWATLESPQKAPRRSKANPAWHPEEIAEALSRAWLGLARAYVLGLSGFDGSTAVTLRWDDYRDGRFSADREKTDVEGYTIVPALFRVFLDAGGRSSEFIITNSDGQPYKNLNTFQTASSKFLAGLADEGIVRKGLTMHGLRHTVGKAIADSGGRLGAIQTALRHSSARMALHYSSEADKKHALESVQDALQDWFLAHGPRPDWHKPEAGQKKS